MPIAGAEPSDWLKISQEWEESDLSQMEYCKGKGISRSHFTQQRSKLIAQGLIKPYYNRSHSKGALPKMRFVPVTLPVQDDSREEVALLQKAESDCIEINLPHGIVMRIPMC